MELTEVPLNHPIYNIHFKFPRGLPKIHEHDGLAPKAMGIFHKNKLVLLFTYESDLGDGWEDSEVHNDSEETRVKALKMGSNIIEYVFLYFLEDFDLPHADIKCTTDLAVSYTHLTLPTKA